MVKNRPKGGGWGASPLRVRVTPFCPLVYIFLRYFVIFSLFSKIALDVPVKRSIIGAPQRSEGKRIERNTSKMIKTIAIILGLTAVTATANTLSPTPEAPAAVLR